MYAIYIEDFDEINGYCGTKPIGIFSTFSEAKNTLTKIKCSFTTAYIFNEKGEVVYEY